MKTKRENCERRLAGMKSQRSPYEQDWQEIASLAMPTRSDILAVANGTTLPKARKSRSNRGLHSSAGRKAARVLTAGMTTGLSSPFSPWFKLRTPDPEMMEFQPVKEWLATVEQDIYAFLQKTNFYNAVKINYAELGCFGTNAGVMVEDMHYGMVTHALTAGEYWIANDRGMIADTLYRRVFMTVSNMVDAFVRKGGWGVVSRAVKDAWDNGNYETVVPCMHAIEPRYLRDVTRDDSKNKPYASIWWEEGQSNKSVLLRESGFDSKPFYSARWVESGGEAIYGDGPGYDALPDLRNLQLAAKRRGRNVDRLDRPPMGAPIGMANTFLSLDPGSLTFGAPMDLGAVKPLYTPDPRLMQFFREEEDDLTKKVSESFYADLFFAITDMEGVQPRNENELNLREQEKLTQLGPVVDRVNVEQLEVVIDRTFDIMLGYGMLRPPPQELEGVPLRVEFISMLARAQKSGERQDIQEAAQFIGYLGAAMPEAYDKLDVDQAIDAFTTASGTPPKIIRSDEVVAQMRQQRAQQQAAAQAAASAPAAADAAKAAQLMSQTNVGGENMLERALG